MTTSEMIEELIQLSYRSYKRQSKGCLEASRLDRKQPTVIDGITFTCWHEYVCYKVCQYIKSKIPDAEVSLELCGNDSTVGVVLDDREEEAINRRMYRLIKEWKE